jgi:mannose-6-phosphate isomerase-like protein (cupin superfamily)
MSEIVDIEQLGWEPVRPEITRDVYGKTLMDQGVKAVLTRVAPGGRFSVHRDRYGHLFYFISGEGAGRVGEKEFKVQPGLVVRVQAGEPHSYENTGTADLMLISLNIA